MRSQVLLIDVVVWALAGGGCGESGSTADGTSFPDGAADSVADTAGDVAVTDVPVQGDAETVADGPAQGDAEVVADVPVELPPDTVPPVVKIEIGRAHV